MKKIIKLLLLLLVSLTVDSKTLCTTDCAKKAIQSNLKSANYEQAIDENNWILNTRFKY